MQSMRKAAVIGTGMMGPGIAATLAKGGLDVTILSRSESGAAAGGLRSEPGFGLDGMSLADMVVRWSF